MAEIKLNIPDSQMNFLKGYSIFIGRPVEELLLDCIDTDIECLLQNFDTDLWASTKDLKEKYKL